MALFGGKSKPVVLIAEDEDNIRNIIKFTLEGAGFEVADFPNGQLALDAVPKVKPDCIMLDVMMPLKNGFEVCYELKNNTQFEKIPVIILTATTQTSSKSDDYWRVKSRADAFMTKPFKANEVVTKVNELIADAKAKGKDSKGKFRI